MNFNETKSFTSCNISDYAHSEVHPHEYLAWFSEGQINIKYLILGKQEI